MELKLKPSRAGGTSLPVGPSIHQAEIRQVTGDHLGVRCPNLCRGLGEGLTPLCLSGVPHESLDLAF